MSFLDILKYGHNARTDKKHNPFSFKIAFELSHLNVNLRIKRTVVGEKKASY